MLALHKVLRALTCVGVVSVSALVPFELIKLGPLQGRAPRPRVGIASMHPVIHSSTGAIRSSARKTSPSPRQSQTAIAAIAAVSAPGHAQSGSKPPLVVAYAPSTDETPSQNPLLKPLPSTHVVDLSGVLEAIAAYHAGDLAGGDELARQVGSPLARTALEWIALRLFPRLPFERFTAFLAAHPGWPAADFVRRRAEVALYADRRSPALINGFFAGHPPETIYGKLALARAKLTAGETNAAAALVREVWLSGDIGVPLETAILSEFHGLLTKADHKARSDGLFYEGLDAAAWRAAVLAGPDVEALAKARAAPWETKLLAAVPRDLRHDPTLLFAKIQQLRRQAKFAAAARALLAAPRDPAVLVNPDKWWTERKFVARKMLDRGDARTAYRLCAQARPTSGKDKLEASFRAGWIALRFLHKPALATPYFAAMARIATIPSSLARAGYWQGRAAEAVGRKGEAMAFYRAAAEYATTYYGQLARAKLGKTDIPIPMPTNIAVGAKRLEVVRVVELLEAVGETDIARSLAVEAARNLDDESQIAALAEVVSKAGDARTTLLVGKAATQRGFPFEAWAFPTFGIPSFNPVGKSAAMPVVYAIARQESAFAPNAVSSAGAMGLMQMIASTARSTAADVGVPFDKSKLLTEPSFNAQLGAAHLGELLHENRGSMILTIAAYNAGSRRVKEWIAAYGDPRNHKVDPVDWVERIPFDETRNYVKRVIENLQTYRQRFGYRTPLKIEADLR